MENNRQNLKQKRIRSFFLSFETSPKKDKKTSEIENEISKKGLSYLQLKLPVDKITPEFEEELQIKVDKNILNAKIREATEEDLESVVYMHNRAWMTANTPFSPINLQSVKSIFQYPETTILIARVYGSDAGFVIIDFEGPNKSIGVIAGLGVIPRFQRKGLGTVLGMAAWQYMKKKNVKELRCEVYVDNKASYNFIKSIGFEEYETKVYKMDDFDENI